MIKILFICHGNICRSPMAEFIMKDLVTRRHLADYFHIESAATSSEEIIGGKGNPVYPPARRELARHGISCEGKYARQLTKVDYDAYDYLVGMEDINIRNMKRILGEDTEHKICKLLDFTDEPGRNISDPWYSGAFDETYRDVVTGCTAFLEYLEKEGKI